MALLVRPLAASPISSGYQHRVADRDRDRALASAESRGLYLSGEQRDAFHHATDGKDLGVVIGYAGTGKSAMLGVAREAWEGAGFQVRGAALSGIAAEGLEASSGIASRTIASLEHQWSQGRELLTARDVLVIDEAGMIGSRQMERVLSHAQDAGAKVVLVGDPEQLQAIEAGAAFRSVAERHGGVEITEIRRQQIDWQRVATRQLATGRTGDALRDYADHGMLHTAETREAARGELIDRWDRERIASPDQSRIILTHTNDEVRELNEAARDRLREAGQLGEDITIKAERGDRQFATGDRLMFLRNDRDLGVKNGSLGEIERINPQSLTVKLDDGRNVQFDTKNYSHVDHGYAATIHKSQGVTVDRAHVLATPGLDRHATYVALSRHREGVQVHYGRDDFASGSDLARTLSRERGKDMASDYSRECGVDPAHSFAERRGISFRKRVVEIARKIVPEKARSIFANFRPPPEQKLDISIEQQRKTGPLDMQRGVERYARALEDIGRMEQKGLSLMPHQETARDKARTALNEMKPKSGRDIDVAFSRQYDGDGGDAVRSHHDARANIGRAFQSGGQPCNGIAPRTGMARRAALHSCPDWLRHPWRLGRAFDVRCADPANLNPRPQRRRAMDWRGDCDLRSDPHHHRHNPPQTTMDSGECRALYHRRLLVHIIHQFRKPGDHDCAEFDQQFFRDCARQCANVHCRAIGRGVACGALGAVVVRWGRVGRFVNLTCPIDRLQMPACRVVARV
jgi:hypothetical protein